MYRTILSLDEESILQRYMMVKSIMLFTAIMSQILHVQITTKAGDINISLKLHIFIIMFIS